MSFGGSVAAMVSSLKNNRQLLISVRIRRKYAFSHHVESKIIDHLKREKVNPEVLARFKRINKAELRKAYRRQIVILTFMVLMAVVLFTSMFHYLKI